VKMNAKARAASTKRYQIQPHRRFLASELR
jgi:hypothetical protein